MFDLDSINLEDMSVNNEIEIQESVNTDIAIIGVAVKLPKADNVAEFWGNVRNGVDCISDFPIDRKKDCDSYLHFTGMAEGEIKYGNGAYLNEVDKFDYSFFQLSPKEASLMNPSQRMFLETVWKAIEDSGYGGKKLSGTKTGVYMGHSMGTFVDMLYDYARFIPDIDPDSIPMAIPGNLTSIIASRISYILDLKGPSICVDTACSSSLVALHYACQGIKNGECDIAIAGSVKLNLFPLERKYKMGIESSDGKAKTFDDDSDGTGRGEGVAAVILKPLSNAFKDRDNIYAVIKGSSVNQDGSSIGITAPSAPAQADVLATAWENAGVDPETITYIETHGTGTKLGDPIEIDGLKRAFKRYTGRKQFCAIGSVKTNIGHLDNASGIVGVVKAVLALKNGEIPPSLHFKYPNRKIDFEDSPVYVNRTLSKWETEGYPRRCGVSAFGLSGTNCHVVIEEAPPQNRIYTKGLDVITLSAKSKKVLEELVEKYKQHIEDSGSSLYPDICYTANTGRGHYSYRVAIIIENQDDLKNKIDYIFTNGLENNISKGIYYGECKPNSTTGNYESSTEHLSEQKQLDIGAKSYYEMVQEPTLFDDLCRLYVMGGEVDWERVYRGEKRNKVSVPVYPFERKRCWLEAPKHECLKVVKGGIHQQAQKEVRLIGRENDQYSEIEIKIAQIWGETLGFDEISINDSFYEIGGDSIIAMKIINGINKNLIIKSDVSDLLGCPELHDFISLIRDKYLRERVNESQDSIKPAANSSYYPVSSPQKMVFLQETYSSTGTAYNIPISVSIKGKVSYDKIKEAFNKLVIRHEALRTVFEFINGDIVQRIIDPDALELEFDYLEDEVDSVNEAIESFVRPFELSKAPLMRGRLLKVSDKEHLLLVDVHHIIADGVSVSILLKEFSQLYEGNNLPELKLQYKDFSAWQNNVFGTPEMRAQEEYWRSKLSLDIPELELPTDFSRNDTRTYKGSTFKFDIGSSVVERLGSLSKKNNVTLNVIVLSAYYLLLSKYSKRKDLIIGTVVSGRTNHQLENIVGMFNNFLPVRFDINGNETFKDILMSTNKSLLEVYQNQDYPYAKMLEEFDIKTDRSRNPIFDTVLIFHNEFNSDEEIRTGELILTTSEISTNTSKLDLKIDIFVRSNNTLQCLLEYNTGLFKPETIEKMTEHFSLLLKQLCENAEESIDAITLFTSEDEQLLEAKRSMNKNEEKESVKIVISSTFTSEPVEDYIRWWTKKFEINIDICFAFYNQIFQELLEPESLTSTNTGINILLIRFEDWIRDRSISEDLLCNKLKDDFNYMVSILREKKKDVPYFVALFPVSTHLSLGFKVTSLIEELSKEWKRALSEMQNIYLVDFTELADLYDIQNVFDLVKDNMGHLPFTDEYYAAMGTMIARRISALNNQSFKVIALDADNTLWRGVCGEDGALGVSIDSPYLELQKFMIEKYNQGMLLVICSKNNEADVWEVFEKNPHMLLKKEHFAGWRINWKYKSDNLKDLARELNLGIDSFIFIDDSITECSEVMTNCPKVLTLNLPQDPQNILPFLKHAWCFDRLKVTEEDKMRTKMYLSEKKRQEVEKEIHSLEDFLVKLELRMCMNDVVKSQVARVSQLTQRTNQFNMSSIRMSEEEISDLMSKPDVKCWTIEVSDRFGDYGLVGVVIAKKESDRLFIDSFMLSCRVLGRGVEDTILSGLARYCKENGLDIIEARYIPTAKNQPFLEFMKRTDWQEIDLHNEEIYFRLAVDKIREDSDYIEFFYGRKYEDKKVNSTDTKQDYVLDHIAVAVRDIDVSMEYFKLLGYKCGEVVHDTLQNAYLTICFKDGYSPIELVAPVNEYSPCSRILEISGENPYHLCYRVRNVNDFLEMLNKNRIEYEIISPAKKAILFNYKEVTFISVRGCGLIELLEDENRSMQTNSVSSVKNIIRIVVADAAKAVELYKQLGYSQIKNTRNSISKVMTLSLYKNGPEIIELIIPQEKEISEYKSLNENGAHIYQVCFEQPKICEFMEIMLKNGYDSYEICGSYKYGEIADAGRLVGTSSANYSVFYTVDKKENLKEEKEWTINTINDQNLLHINQLLPLINHTGKQLLSLPLYALEGKNIIKTEYVEPRNEAEQRITAIWEEVLGVQKIGINDNFFDLGGNSVKGVQIVSKMTLDFEIHLNDIFKYTTIAILSENVPLKENHFLLNLKKMKNMADSAQTRDYKDDKGAVEKIELYKNKIQVYRDIDVEVNQEYKDILILGAAGYLGTHLLYEILEGTESKVHLLLRGKTVDDAEKKCKDRLEFYFNKHVYERFKSRISIYVGDLSKNNIGLPEDLYSSLSEKIDCIINSAANVKHYGKFEEFYDSNIKGVENIIAFASNCRKKDIHHISTINVAHGKVEGKDNFVFTEFDHDIGQIEENFYIKTKIESEKLMVKARMNDLNANIYRVGNLVYSTQTEKFQSNIGDNAFYTLVKSFIKIERIPNIDRDILDFSFVNRTARAISLLFNRKNLINETYHVFNYNRISFADLGQYINNIGYNVEIEQIGDFFQFIYDNYENPELKTHVLNILVHGYIMGDINDTNFYIQSDKTSLILDKLNFNWDKIDSKVIEGMLEYCRKVGFI